MLHSVPTTDNAAALPALTMTNLDHARLSDLVYGLADGGSTAADFLADELDRARVVAAEAITPDVVTMNSHLVFEDHAQHALREVTLVYPGEADIRSNRLSILTPVGAALIGLSVGQTMEWTTRTGERRRLTVVRVVFQPEATIQVDSR